MAGLVAVLHANVHAEVLGPTGCCPPLRGDKSGAWAEWYEWAVPAADDLYEVYMAELRKEGLI